jgi:NAD(P) transhydrogenase alpha subunit
MHWILTIISVFVPVSSLLPSLRNHKLINFNTYAYDWKTPVPYKDISIGVVKENVAFENRVAQSPESIAMLVKAGFTVYIQQEAGISAGFQDDDYIKYGGRIVDHMKVWESDIVVKVQPPTDSELLLLGGRTLISFVYPAQNQVILDLVQKHKGTLFAMDQIPRLLSRGQAYDVLSSQANIAGYRAVVEAANEFGRFFTGQITAAGKVPPAKVLILGAGVAGLAAIGAAKSLGAVVSAYDVRPVVKEQV